VIKSSPTCMVKGETRGDKTRCTPQALDNKHPPVVELATGSARTEAGKTLTTTYRQYGHN